MKLSKEMAAEMKALLAIAEDARTAEQQARIDELQAMLDAVETPANTGNTDTTRVARTAKYNTREEALANGGDAEAQKITRQLAFSHYKPGNKGVLVCMKENGDLEEVSVIVDGLPRHMKAAALAARREAIANGEPLIGVPAEMVGFDQMVKGQTVEVILTQKGYIGGLEGQAQYVALEAREEIRCLSTKCPASELVILSSAASNAQILAKKFGLDVNATFASLSRQVGGAKVSAAALAEAEL